jgi:CRISPR-associated protein Cmr2
MKSYLFTLTISPVQSFIAQARKSQDLFAGSEILSQLMGKVLETFTEKERIFPQDEKAVSNKIVVKLVDKDPIEIGEKLEKLVRDELYRIGSKTLLSFQGVSINMQFFQEHIQTQLCEFFQVFWVAVDYQEGYVKLEKNLGAIKNLRQFHQLPQESGQKCSLCGERNGLFYNNDKPPRYIIKNAIRIQDARIQDNETLCAVCFTKRNYKQNGSFPSLADIVTFDRKDKLNGQDAEAFLDANPSEKKHYALLHFDVDSLGKTLSGLVMQGQKDLSTVLGDFAQKVGSEVLTSQKGRTVYAGGDDFLGFVNLASVFVVMQKIKDAFGEAKASLPYALTFSTSIVIAHYKTPLHKVLDYSRELLEESKNHFDDKNGLGIMVMSSNAVISKTICRYDDVALLQELKEKGMAKNLHFKLAQIFDYLESQQNIKKEDYDSLILMLEYEIKRLLKREEGSFDETLYEKLVLFLHRQVSGLKTEDKIKINFDNFTQFLKTLEQLRKVCYDKIYDDKTA